MEKGGNRKMTTITENKYYVLPATVTGVHELDAGDSISSDGSGLNLTGYEKIIRISSTGDIDVMPQHNPVVTGSFWVDFRDTVMNINAWTRDLRFDSEIDGDVRVNITSKESVDTIKVKVTIIQWTITGAYITIPQYRELTKINHVMVGDDVLAYYIDMAHADIIGHVGSDKTSADTFWRLIQQAEAMLATHYGVVNSWELTPIEKTSAKAISSQWKEQYRELILTLTGRDPFPDIDDIQDVGSAYESKVSTITPDEDSYILSTTR